MKKYINPPQTQWAAILARPTMDWRKLEGVVASILDAVQQEGDAALQTYSERFDGVSLNSFLATQTEIESAKTNVSPALKKAIQIAKSNIEQFHKAQKSPPQIIETMPGIQCWRKSIGIEKVGLYIPGGTAPLFSTVLMLGVPAQIAGCKEVILCTPPQADGSIHPAILYAAGLVGIRQIFKIGGAQAVGAMAYGTETVPQVYKIFGPGNQYVTAAKQLVHKAGIAIDLPAGPSEVLVVADDSAVPAFVAADLLSQAEHGLDSQVVLVTFNEDLAQRVDAELLLQLKNLPRQEIAKKVIENGTMVIVASEKEAQNIVNEYAPEHLIISTKYPEGFAEGILNAGSIFLGNFTPESVGDYASGTNHTLPTNGFAKAYSGVSLDTFVKKITYQKLTKEGLKNIAQTVETMAAAEALFAHKNAVSIRLEKQ